LARVSFTTSGTLRKSALRLANERLVLDAIRRNPGISRAEIARSTGFSRPSVTFVVNRLINERLVTEGKSEGSTQNGRRPVALQLRAQAKTAIGVEIARPNSRVVLVDLNGKTLEGATVAWQSDPKVFLEHLEHAIRSVASERKSSQVLGVGVSMPGTIDSATGRIVAAEALGWFDVEVGEILRNRLKWPIYFENDANLCALGEQWYAPPADEDLRYFVYLHLQGGLGSGVFVDGRMLHGVASAAAEFGHVMLYPDGRPCNCGNRGCWEQYASDGALVRAYQELSGVLEDSVAIVNLARGGDAHAAAALRTNAEYLGLGLVNLIAALNPQAIIFGEPISSAWDLVADVVDAELRKRVPPYCLNGLRLLPSRLGADSALLGAAAFALDHFFSRFDHTTGDSPPNRVAIKMYA
jgi:predicted NBD/HSP70 family sugar kinase